MNGSCLHSDVVLPAATWYEKHDISTTDLHPFVHAFTPAIGPPWETRTDWDIFVRAGRVVLAARRAPPGGAHRPGGGAPAARHARRAGPDRRPGARLEARRVRADPRPDDAEADPGRARLPGAARRMTALGPLVETAGTAWKGVSWTPDVEVEELGVRHGTRARRARGRAAAHGAGRAGLRDDPRPVGHHQRAPGARELPGAREAHRQRAGRPRRPSTPTPASPTRTPRSSRAR